MDVKDWEKWDIYGLDIPFLETDASAKITYPLTRYLNL